jgi:hypothetical protein
LICIHSIVNEIKDADRHSLPLMPSFYVLCEKTVQEVNFVILREYPINIVIILEEEEASLMLIGKISFAPKAESTL